MYFISFYNTFMKLFFISSSVYIIYLMKYKRPYCTTYDEFGDKFPHIKFLLPGALVLTLVVQTGWSWWEFMWSYSLWLEALAFIP